MTIQIDPEKLISEVFARIVKSEVSKYGGKLNIHHINDNGTCVKYNYSGDLETLSYVIKDMKRKYNIEDQE